MQPWAPTLTPHQTRRAGKTLEELNERGAVLARIQIQALDDIDPGSGETNRARLEKKMADVYAQLRLMREAFGLDIGKISTRMDQKIQLMAEWEAHLK